MPAGAERKQRVWLQAETEFRKAIDRDYGYSTTHHWYGVHLDAMGRFAESQVELARARELDRLSPMVTLNSGYPLYYQKQYREALSIYGWNSTRRSHRLTMTG